MAIISEARPNVPPDLLTDEEGAETRNEAYSLNAPHLASEPLTMKAPDGTTFSWRPTELAYRDESGLLDYIVGSSPSNLSTRGREARYHRTFPGADDVFIAEDMQVKHWTVLHEPPREPAEYLGDGVEFGVSGIVNGVPLPPGSQEEIRSGPFCFPRPYVKDMAGNEVYGRYEVIDTDEGQQLFIWFDAEFLTNALYPVMIDPTIVVSSTIRTDENPGARKIIQLDNGDLIAAIRYTDDGWGNYYINLYRSRNNGLTWGPHKEYMNNRVTNSSFALTSHGNSYYLMYPEPRSFDGYTRIRLQTSLGSYYISDKSGLAELEGAGVSICSDHTGTLYAVWPERDRGSTPTHSLAYSRSTNGGVSWSEPEQIISYTGSGAGFTNPCIVAGRYGRPVVAVENGSANRITILRLDGTWTSEDLPTAGSVSQPTMFADRSNIYLAIKNGSNIEYFRSRNDGSTWSTNNIAVNNGVNSHPSIVVDNDGVVHLFWGRGGRTYHKIYEGSSWGVESFVDIGDNPSAMVSDTIIGWTCLSGNSYRFDKIIFNTPPTAPTRLSRSDFDAEQPAIFSWQFNDPNPGDTQSAYIIEYLENVEGASAVRSSKISSSSSQHSFPANTFENGKNYMWRVRTYDLRGEESPWSDWAAFKCATMPIAVVTDPLPNAGLTGDTYAFRGSYSQAQGIRQKSFRFLLWNDSETEVLQDSGEIIGTANTHTFIDLENERDYKIQLEVKSQDDMVGRSEMVDFRTSFIKPRPPSILLSQDSVFATTTILIENPTPVGEEPNIIINEIYRKRYGESDWVKVGEAMTIFTDYQCPAGAIQYMAVAKGDNGTRSEDSD
ncbi:sialidase family protein, partial [Ammoniphilus oxalaticus]|uniref:sialidase family protein n=1 Tax=Ammoniphilus oxalaticus TaxID=66863 RepID=UPI0011C45610